MDNRLFNETSSSSSSHSPLIPSLPQVPLIPQQLMPSGSRKDCIRLRGLPYEAQVEQILEFLSEHSKNIVFQGVHMVYNAQVSLSHDIKVEKTCWFMSCCLTGRESGQLLFNFFSWKKDKLDDKCVGRDSCLVIIAWRIIILLLEHHSKLEQEKTHYHTRKRAGESCSFFITGNFSFVLTVVV